MADKFPVRAGATSVSVDMKLRSASDGTEVVGKVAADMTASYWRQGGSPTAIAVTDLAAITTAWTSGGVKEASNTLAKGSYRIDVPDAAFATGADWVEINLSVPGSYVATERIPLSLKSASDVYTYLTTNDVWDELAASHNTAGTMGAKLNAAGSAADPLANPVPGAYAAGTAGAVIGSNLWDQSAASHNTAGTMGAKVNAAGAASDPLASAVPGAYGAGTAGNILGNLFTASMTESYAADGAPASLSQILYMILQLLTEKSVVSTTMTVKKLDGITTAMTFTLNSPTTPTSITRTS